MITTELKIITESAYQVNLAKPSMERISSGSSGPGVHPAGPEIQTRLAIALARHGLIKNRLAERAIAAGQNVAAVFLPA